MPSWYLKAAIQGALSLLPQSYRWNYLFQRHVSRGLRLTDAYFEQKLKRCVRHLEYYRVHRQSEPRRVLELGTGWLPIVPIGLALSTEADILSIDVTSLMRHELVQETLEYFVNYADDGRLKQHLPDLQPTRVARLRSTLAEMPKLDTAEALQQLHVKTIVGDAQTIQINDIDLFVSNNTLEHIPPDTIERIFLNIKSMLTPDGLMSHLIDLSDHYSHFDNRLTPYNFLQYSPSHWRLYNNDLQYQNRLRVSDYRAIHQQAGYELIQEDSEASLSKLPETLMLAPEFAKYTLDDLLQTSSWMVSIPTNA